MRKTSIRDLFDGVITMDRKKKAFAYIIFTVVSLLFLDLAKFTQPALPLSQYKGVCSGDTCAIIMFSLWVISFALGFKYLVMDTETLGFREIVLQNAFTAFFIIALIIQLSIIIMIYLYSGKLCILGNQACLN